MSLIAKWEEIVDAVNEALKKEDVVLWEWKKTVDGVKRGIIVYMEFDYDGSICFRFDSNSDLYCLTCQELEDRGKAITAFPRNIGIRLF